MERKKSKILTHYDEILDEKFALQDNLEKVINQVFSCVDYIKKSPEDIKQKDCSLILKHQLEVLKKLTEINSELESVIEENPLKVLNISEKQYEDDTKKSQEECKSETPDVSNLVVNKKSLDSCTETDFNGVVCSSYISELISSERVEPQHDSGDDIQTLRDTLKKFSEKLGFNDECISSIKDYYNKPSTSSIRDIFDKPSSIQISSQIQDFSIDNANTSSTNFETNPASTFEFPEKDTNITINAEHDVNENRVKLYLPVESASNAASCSQSDTIENGIDVSPPNEINRTVICCGDESSSSTDIEVSSALNIVEVVSSEEPFSVNNSVSKTSDLSPDSGDNGCTKTEDSECSPKKIVYTAVEKLNNTKIFNRREEALKVLMSTVDVPDIKLQPATTKCSSIIKNDFEANSNNKLRKKKNRKKKSEIKNDNVIYECCKIHLRAPSDIT